MDNYIMIEGKKIPLTDEQVKTLKDTKVPGGKQKSPFERAGHTQKYYFICDTGNVSYTVDIATLEDNRRFATANYCTDRKLMEQRALHEALSRLLWRFSMENGEVENPWDGVMAHWHIYCDTSTQQFDTSWTRFCIHCCDIYFPTEKLAQRAIDEIVKPFMKEHPDFVW